MSFFDKLLRIPKSAFQVAKEAYKPYANTLKSAAYTLGSKQSQRAAEADYQNLLKSKQILSRTLEENDPQKRQSMLEKSRKIDRASSYSGKLAENFAQKALDTREDAGLTGSFQQGIKPGLKTTGQGLFNTARAGAYTAGAGALIANPAAAILPATLSGGLGYGAAKISGQDPYEAIGRGLGHIPYYTGFQKLSDPLIAKGFKKFGGALGPVAERTAATAASVGQGILQDKAAGYPVTPTSLGIDAGLGAVMGKGIFGSADDTIRGLLKQEPRVKIDDATTDEIFSLKTFFDRRDMKSLSEETKQQIEDVDRLFKKFVPPELQPKKTTAIPAQKKLDILAELAAENKAYRSGALTNARGLVGDEADKTKKPVTVEDILNQKKVQTDPIEGIEDTAKLLAEEHQFVGQGDSDYFEMLQRMGWEPEQIDRGLRQAESLAKEMDIENPKGWGVYMMRKMFPDAETASVKSVIGKKLADSDMSPEDINKIEKTAEKIAKSRGFKNTDEMLEQTKNIPRPSKVEVEPPDTSSNEFKLGFTGKKQDFELPDPQKIEDPTRAANAFKKGRDYLYGRLESLNATLDEMGLSKKDFRKIIEDPNQSITPNLKKLTEEYQDILDEALKLSGGEVKKRENYMPHVWAVQRMVEEVLPDTFIDTMNRTFGNLMPRLKNSPGYIEDPITAAQHYVDRALSYKYAEVIADRRGVSVDVVKAEQQIAQKLGNALRDKKPISLRKDIEKLAELKGVKANSKEVEEGVNILEEVVFDGYRNLKKLGIYEEAFSPLVRHKAIARLDIFEPEVLPLLRKGDYMGAARRIAKIDRSVDAELLFKKATKYDNEELVENIFYQATEKAQKSKGLSNLIDRLAEYEFKDGRTADYVELQAKLYLGQSVVAKDTTSKILSRVRRTLASGAIGFNARSASNNLFEPKRVLAATSADSTAKGYKLAIKDERNILEEYGTQSRNIDSYLKERFNLNESQIKKLHKKFTDASFEVFNHTERFKDKVFLYALEAEAAKKGLKGSAKTKYVMGEFERLAHKFDHIGTIGMFNNDIVKTALQFSQYGMKELQVMWDVAGDISKGEREAMEYLAKWSATNLGIFAVTNAIYGARPQEVFLDLPVSLGDDGFIVNSGPAGSLITETFGAVNRYKEMNKEDEEIDWDKVFDSGFRRTAALGIPGGNQFINKTGSSIRDMIKGYNPSASGRARFLSPEGITDTATGLIYGPYATQESREYWDEDRQPLGEKQTQTFEQLQQSDRGLARDYYEGIMSSREAGSEEKKAERRTVKEILAGKGAGTPTQQKIVQSRQETIQGLMQQGITDKDEIKDILDEQAKASGFSGHDFSDSEIEGYMELSKTSSPTSIMDIVQKDAEQSRKRTLIGKVLTGKESGVQDMSEEQKMQYLQAQGVDESDMQDYLTWKLSNAKVKDRAEYIVSNKRTDFVQLYKDEVLTSSVAEELEKRGYIPDADTLMDQMKLSDPYYVKKAKQKLALDYKKDLAEQRAKTAKKSIKAILSANTKATKSLKIPEIKSPKLGNVSLSKSHLNKLAKPKPYSTKL